MSTHPPTQPKPVVAAATVEHDALPAGTRFGEFEIVRVLGVGGFGIVYLARDHSLEREVALKEYMPASLAARGVGPQITVRSASFAETYAIGLRSFVNEARLLARFDHPSLVKVYRFWEDNATAYMVMPYLQGTTLRDVRRAMAHAPDEAWVRSVITPILSALELLHREGVYHRDIAPDNILLPRQGPPVLLDFGAARRVISDRTQSLTAILKPSYAPIEQYAEMAQLRQGPWTDLYALGAVIHYLLFGVPPAPATARAVQDDGDAIETRIVPGVSPRFLEAMSWMLAIRPNQRPQSGEQLRAVLDGQAEIPVRRGGTTIPGASAPAVPDAMASRPLASGVDATGVDIGFAPTYIDTTRAGSAARPRAVAPPSRPLPAVAPPRPTQAVSRATTRPVVWLALAGGAVVAVAAVMAWQLLPRRAAASVEQAGVAASAAANVVAAPMSVPAPATARRAPTPVPLAIAEPASNAVSTTPSPQVQAPLPGPPRSPATATAAATARPALGSERATLAENAAAVNAGPVAGAARPHPTGRPVPTPGDEPATASTTPARMPEHAPAAPIASVEPATVREACGNRRFIALAICMDRRCEEARYRTSPECVAILSRKATREGYAPN